jgi:hypothetical protein
VAWQWLLGSDGVAKAATVGDNQTTLQKNGVLQVLMMVARRRSDSD